ncbi:MAG: glycosyltransferase N-terminal domain-containing protein [Pseudomonadota bacterium]
MFLYRIVLTLLSPLIVADLALRALRGRESWADVTERLGWRREPLPAGALWLHGASNGELTAARRLVEGLKTRHPDLPILVTANSVTGRDMVRGWGSTGVVARLAPLDFRALCLRGFLGRLRPRALVSMENELWPNRLAILHARGVPTALVAARVSERSARRWAWLGWLLRPLLAPVALALPQDNGSAALLVALGLPEAAIGPQARLKAAVALAPPPAEELGRIAPFFSRADTLLAASTHEGEDALILDAFVAARQVRPNLRLILAPRHPRRAPEIEGLIGAAGLSYATRSGGERPGMEPVYLADTMGEMALWYALSGICIIGGSFVPKGGHTPYEPAQFGCALVHGPDMSNQVEAMAYLRAADAAIEVEDARALAAQLELLDAKAQAAKGARARDALAPPDLAPLLDALDRALALDADRA